MGTLCIIPARGGSKAIPKKNIVTVGGKPLIGYVIETILESEAFNRVVLSTDSEEIAEVVSSRYPAIEIPFIRPQEFARDEVSLVYVVKHAVEYLENQNSYYDLVFSIQPTSPLIRPETIKLAVRLMEKTHCDSVVTITKIIHFHPFRAYKYDNETSRISPLTEYTTESYQQKQDRPEAYGMTGAIFGRKRSLLNYWNGKNFALGDNVKGIVVSQEESLDIDTPFDMKVFEGLVILRGMKA